MLGRHRDNLVRENGRPGSSPDGAGMSTSRRRSPVRGRRAPDRVALADDGAHAAYCSSGTTYDSTRPDQVAREREDVAERESVDLTGLLSRLAVAGRDDGVGRFDEAIDGQRGAADEVLVLDLAVEPTLARQQRVAGEIPDDVVGQATEDLFVIAAAEPVEVRFDHVRAC